MIVFSLYLSARMHWFSRGVSSLRLLVVLFFFLCADLLVTCGSSLTCLASRPQDIKFSQSLLVFLACWVSTGAQITAPAAPAWCFLFRAPAIFSAPRPALVVGCCLIFPHRCSDPGLQPALCFSSVADQPGCRLKLLSCRASRIWPAGSTWIATARRKVLSTSVERIVRSFAFCVISSCGLTDGSSCGLTDGSVSWYCTWASGSKAWVFFVLLVLR
jgi:hypothetical protein